MIEKAPSGQTSKASGTDRATRTGLCHPFSPVRLRRQLLMDGSIRWVIFLALGVCIAGASMWGQGGSGISGGLIILIVPAIWIGISIISVRAAQQLSQITELIEKDLPAAEAMLATTIARQPLQRSLRLLLYHRLATLRQRQHRLPEAATICQALLSQRKGVSKEIRVHLLLMLAEAQLHHQDLGGAHHSLVELHRTPLNLLESSQRLSLQVRYEVIAGHDQAALYDIKRKIQMAELLPPAQCGALHLILATAARRTSVKPLAQWLQDRAQLMCTAQQIESISQPGGIPSTSDPV